MAKSPESGLPAIAYEKSLLNESPTSARFPLQEVVGQDDNLIASWGRTTSRFQVFSYEAGAHKPDPAPYLLAERRLPASEYAMVGDSADDVEGARQVGWTAYRYTGGGFGDLPDALDWELPT